MYIYVYKTFHVEMYFVSYISIMFVVVEQA